MFQLFALFLRNDDKSTVGQFIPCSARHFWKGAKFAGSVGHPMTKILSASGALRPPDPLTRGSAPGPRWGLCPQTSVIGSYSALAMLPPNHWPVPPPMTPWKKSCGRPCLPLVKWDDNHGPGREVVTTCCLVSANVSCRLSVSETGASCCVFYLQFFNYVLCCMCCVRLSY